MYNVSEKRALDFCRNASVTTQKDFENAEGFLASKMGSIHYALVCWIRKNKARNKNESFEGYAPPFIFHNSLVRYF
jgi:hypothetical protein